MKAIILAAMSKRLYGIIFITVVSSFFLSGCTTPEEDGSVNLLYNSANQQLNNTNAKTATTKGAMKTINDFENIPATQATIKTSKGEITIELYRDQAPITTANFLNLAKSGFYNGIVFHRVIADFMAQVGDPLTKDPSKQAQWGTGGPGYTIPDEFGAGLTHDSEGMVSMANSGPNTGGSQFFITFGPTQWLDGKHAIFGKVTQGLEVLHQIQQGDTITSISYQ
jgi:cyclophilin family peptidyl-prolyl cis-trans isomerase